MVTPPDNRDAHSGRACFGQLPAAHKGKCGPNLVSDALPSIAFGRVSRTQSATRSATQSFLAAHMMVDPRLRCSEQCDRDA